MIIRHLRCLPQPLYDRVVDLQNEGLLWHHIVEKIEIEFEDYLKLNYDVFCKWHDLTVYTSEILSNTETILKKHGYRQIDIFNIRRDELFLFLNARSIEYICIDDYTKNMFIMYIKEEDYSKNVAIIGLHQHVYLPRTDWYHFSLCDLPISKEIAKNKKMSQYEHEVFLPVVAIVKKWVEENNIKFYHVIYDGKIYFERECDAALFKITFA